MAKNMLSGITVVGGVHISNFVILMIAGVTIGGLALGVNLWEKKKKEGYYGRRTISGAARAYQADSNAHEIAQRILTTVINNAGNREEIAENMDYISAKINEKMGTITSLAQQRRNGEIDRQQFRAEIRQLIIQIMDELQMQLRPRGNRPDVPPGLANRPMPPYPRPERVMPPYPRPGRPMPPYS